ncbi:restriction endonuclease subunit S [Sphingobacteriales bacterium UPWRP_1]|nr:hypothetical protein BVG80_04625 [Sphingobacteriales bacterium TSM_CSM]PSJ76105.1 restriction endonuclease subunit S [Sphingobacteriales bacterium UPWRP_1]
MKQGWEIKKLGEVSEILNGGTPKTNIAEYWDGDIHWITPADLGKLRKPTVDDTPRKITRLGLEKSSAKLFPTSSIILSTRAPIGHLAINEVPMCTNQGCRGIVPSKKLDTWFLYYFLKNNIELLDSLGTGATFKELSTKALAGVSIPLPPIPEQKRIVSILDECFAAIDKAKANAEQNLKNAKELFESYLQGVFENGNYKSLDFGEVCELVGGSQPSKEQFIYVPKEGYIRLIQVRDYRTDKFVTYIPKSLAKRFCDKEDIMIGRYGPPIFGIFKGLEGAYNVALMKAVVNEKLCDRTYFYWFLQNNKIREFVEQSSKRAVGQDGVRKELLEKYPVPVPPIKAQQTIVRQLDALRTETQKLEAVYQKKIADLEELKKSILQKAFLGQLTMNNG